MHKVMIFLKRRPDLSFADFKNWAENQHTKIAAKLPGIRGYRMNVPPAEAPGAPYDAVSEIWFDSAEARATAVSGFRRATPRNGICSIARERQGARIGLGEPGLCRR